MRGIVELLRSLPMRDQTTILAQAVREGTLTRVGADGRQDPERGANTHGHLDIAGLVRLLLEDVVLTERRPGSWEGSKMGDLLASHGYEA